MDELKKCPLCNSVHIVTKRHDSDWGGGDIDKANPDECYTEYELEEIGDGTQMGIEVYVCFECGFIWDKYLPIPNPIAAKDQEIARLHSEAWHVIIVNQDCPDVDGEYEVISDCEVTVETVSYSVIDGWDTHHWIAAWRRVMK